MLTLEQLEERCLLNAGYQFVESPVGASDPTPAQMRQAYGLTANDTGAGQTIAIVDAYNQPNIVSDLANFDSTFGLPNPPSFTEINENGGSSLPQNAPGGGWGVETSLDVEWAHVIAPAANILLVEANSSNGSDLFAGVGTAAGYPGVSVVSCSWIISYEFFGDPSYNSYFMTPAGHNGVTFVAGTGDNGEGSGVYYPAISPNVVAVGGTTLSTDQNGNWLSESDWGPSGGGVSQIYNEPSWQISVAGNLGGRGSPDVAMDADPNTSVTVIDSYDGNHAGGGTSLSTQLFAGVMADVNSLRASVGLTSLDGPTQTLPMLYSLAGTGAFHELGGTTYNTQTGLGSPNGNVFISDMAGLPNLAGLPVINGNIPSLAGVQRSMVDSIEYNFTEPITLTSANFSITPVIDNTTTGDEVGISPTLVVTEVTPTEWVVSFTGNGVVGNSIANGAYAITITAPGIQETDTFYRLYGDITGAQDITNVDINALNRAWGSVAGNLNFIAALDYNDDGRYTNVDINAFNRTFGTKFDVVTTI